MNGLVIADLHAGSVFGLTPPGWWRADLKIIEEPFWEWFCWAVDKHAPYDFVVCNGDATDGEGKREMLAQLITDTYVQAEMAAAAIRRIPLKPIHGEKPQRLMTWGTLFHTVGTYDYEKAVANMVDAKIEDTIRLEFNQTRGNWRHVVGRSDIPYGQGTPLYKEAVRDILQAEAREYQAATHIFRAHVHYCCRMDIDKVTITSPSLQLPESVFGRGCRPQYYHVGLLRVTDEGEEPGELRVSRLIMPLQLIKKVEYICLDN